MKKLISTMKHGIAALLMLPLALAGNAAGAAVAGITGPSFSLTAKADYISTSDGNSLLMWGYANGDGTMQYPGPTLIVTQGQIVTVTLTNNLPVTVSIVFPGQSGVTTSGGTPGLLTQEAAPGATVVYTFTASRPGTFMYYSGTNPGLQVEMGLVGALIVRPSGATNQAYGHATTAFDREHLFVLTEIDKRIHEQVAFMGNQVNDATASTIDLTSYHATLWFFNGRNGPDSMFADGAAWLPTQPYGSLVRARPGERLLIRLVGAGRDMHPFHTHGNHMQVIARDGRLLASASGGGAPDLAYLDYTQNVVPGETYDALYTWTGQGLGWDVYGVGTTAEYAHTCNGLNVASPGFDPVTHEWCEDHNKPIPVALPQQQDTLFGGFWSGSPYLGVFGALPPGEGGLNPNSGFTYMWHSHTEIELTNDDIFPGGMMTMLIIEPPGTPIE